MFQMNYGPECDYPHRLGPLPAPFLLLFQIDIIQKIVIIPMLLSDSNHITLVVGKARLLPSAPRISNHEYMNIVSPSVRAWQLGNTHPSLNYYYQLLKYCTKSETQYPSRYHTIHTYQYELNQTILNPARNEPENT